MKVINTLMKTVIDHIYALYETESGKIFYVGRSEDPKRRMKEHRYGARICNQDSEDKYQYASALNKLKIKWDMKILQECQPEDEYFEDFYINKYRLAGEPIQNMRAGEDEPWMGRNYDSVEEFLVTREKLIEQAAQRVVARKEPKLKTYDSRTRFFGDFGGNIPISAGLQAIMNRRKKV